jgi:hypothetical protein
MKLHYGAWFQDALIEITKVYSLGFPEWEDIFEVHGTRFCCRCKDMYLDLQDEVCGDLFHASKT